MLAELDVMEWMTNCIDQFHQKLGRTGVVPKTLSLVLRTQRYQGLLEPPDF